MTQQEFIRLKKGSKVILNGKQEIIEEMGYFLHPLTRKQTLGAKLKNYSHSPYVGYKCFQSSKKMTKQKKDIYIVNVRNLGLADGKKQKKILQKVVALTHVFPKDFISAINGTLELYNRLTPKNENSLRKNVSYDMENIQVSVKDMKIQKWNILKLSDIKHPILTKKENKELDGILNLFDYIQDACEEQGAKKHDVFSLPKNDSEKALNTFNAQWDAEMEALNNYITNSTQKLK